MHPRPVRYGNCDDEFIRSGRIGNPKRDRIVVRPDKQGILVRQWKVQRLASRGGLCGGGDPRGASANGLAQSISERGRDTGHDMLLLASESGDSSFSIPLHGVAPEQLKGPLAERGA